MKFWIKVPSKFSFWWKIGIHEVGKGSWKKRSRKVPLESYRSSWKVTIKVGKFSMHYENNQNFSNSIFPISFRTFQLQSFQLLVFLTDLSYYIYTGKSNRKWPKIVVFIFILHSVSYKHNQIMHFLMFSGDMIVEIAKIPKSDFRPSKEIVG